MITVVYQSLNREQSNFFSDLFIGSLDQEVVENIMRKSLIIMYFGDFYLAFIYNIDSVYYIVVISSPV